MPTLLAVAGFAGVLFWIGRTRPYIYYLYGFLLVAWIWKTVDVAYLDLFGPVFAIELFRDIGGTGATPLLVLGYTLALLVLAFVFRRSRVDALLAAPRPAGEAAVARLETVSRIAFALFSAFVIALFLDMARSGVVPVLEGMERWVYTEEHGGWVNAALNKYLMLVGFYFGLFYWYPTIYGRNPDSRFLLLLLALYAFLFLAAHRFSAFYSSGTYFVIPGALQALLRRRGDIGKISFAFTSRWLTRTVQVLAVLIAVGLIGSAIYRSMFIVRFVGSEAAEFGLQQRLLVQQGELWVGSHDRVFRRDAADPARTFHRLFVDPVALPGRNTTVPYLMELEIGEAAYDVIAQGSSYSGGYPEIVFELLGKWGGWGGLLVMAAACALLFRALAAAIMQQRFIAIILWMYVLWPFFTFHGAGMLNYLNNWKYGVKVFALLVWTLFEHIRRLEQPAHGPQNATAGTVIPLVGGQSE